jgi:hypothetical protein
LCAVFVWHSNGAMAEWSKAVDLSPSSTDSTGEIRVGSNPTGTINLLKSWDRFFISVEFIQKWHDWRRLNAGFDS